ncbi:hypothetical protein BC939DRAFT_466102 [Gamsiella multidivaricata]|uniref:uncharacterized protein n=1 Tax=Gamsiella multidivaricata TaxID=101098 RepID=UPI002220B26B|nr:uncharacterized protein BC939DRAFT_466102 [Gamsiella multidivaricata]KAI7817341.1 hypothetical protein BC939DRAFT_466102 [Gamsiella multidivaricata]
MDAEGRKRKKQSTSLSLTHTHTHTRLCMPLVLSTSFLLLSRPAHAADETASVGVRSRHDKTREQLLAEHAQPNGGDANQSNLKSKLKKPGGLCVCVCLVCILCCGMLCDVVSMHGVHGVHCVPIMCIKLCGAARYSPYCSSIRWRACLALPSSSSSTPLSAFSDSSSLPEYTASSSSSMLRTTSSSTPPSSLSSTMPSASLSIFSSALSPMLPTLPS